MKRKLVLLLATFMCISLCACGGSESKSGDNNSETKQEESGFAPNQPTETTEQEIEITLDNWQEYFELRYDFESVEIVKNPFDEIEEVKVNDGGTAIFLKEEYVEDFVSVDVAVEVNTNQASAGLLIYNLDTGEYELEEFNDFERAVSFFSETPHNFSNQSYMKEVKDVKCRVVTNWVYKFDSIEENVANIYVLTCPNTEVTRIQGTLVIKE